MVFSVLYDRGFAIPPSLKGLRRKLLFRLESISNNGKEISGNELQWNKRNLKSLNLFCKTVLAQSIVKNKFQGFHL